MKSFSSGTMTSTIARLCPAVTGKIQLRRKYKCNESGRVTRWQFVIRGDEETLVELENMWTSVFMHTSWKLEECFKPKEASTLSLIEITKDEQAAPVSLVSPEPSTTENASKPPTTENVSDTQDPCYTPALIPTPPQQSSGDSSGTSETNNFFLES